MSDFNNGYARPLPQTADMSVDAGLRGFMLGVYNKLALGLVVAAALAYVTGNVPAVQGLLFGVTPDGRVGLTVLGMIVQFSPLVLLFGSMFFMKNPTAKGVNLLYWAVVASIGAGLGILFLRYTGASLASTFLVTAAAFGGLSLVGYTTKKDLTAMGTFLIFGVIGLIIASVVNIFIGSTVLQMAVSAITVLVFTGLTAYDTQRIKSEFYEGNPADVLTKQAVFGAVALYVNFLNIFMALLSLFGQKNE